MMTRTDARQFMLEVFFQMEACGDFDINNKAHYFKDKDLGIQRKYCDELYSLLCNKREEIDSVIDAHSKNWRASRMPKTDLAILRISVCELQFMEGVPEAVSINEAVDLAKKYGTDDSQKYVNAILGSVATDKKA